MSIPLAPLLVSVAVAWPLAVIAWSLPDRFFQPSSLPSATRGVTVLSILLPILCGVWAGVAVPDFALPGILLLGWALVVLAIVDARTFVLPDCITLPLIVAGIAYSAWINVAGPPPAGQYAIEAGWSFLAAAAGYVFMALVARTFRALRGMDGLGLGDAKLLAAAGAWTGLTALPSIILLAAVAALTVTLLARLFSTAAPLARATPIPFGPYLAGGTWIVVLYGPLALN